MLETAITVNYITKDKINLLLQSHPVQPVFTAYRKFIMDMKTLSLDVELWQDANL